MTDKYAPHSVFTQAIDALPLPSDGTGTTFPGSFMFELLEKADITPGKKTVILEVLDKLVNTCWLTVFSYILQYMNWSVLTELYIII